MLRILLETEKSEACCLLLALRSIQLMTVEPRPRYSVLQLLGESGAYVLMYPDHLQKWFDFGHSLVAKKHSEIGLSGHSKKTSCLNRPKYGILMYLEHLQKKVHFGQYWPSFGLLLAKKLSVIGVSEHSKQNAWNCPKCDMQLYHERGGQKREAYSLCPVWFVTGFRAVSGDCAITDALIIFPIKGVYFLSIQF